MADPTPHDAHHPDGAHVEADHPEAEHPEAEHLEADHLDADHLDAELLGSPRFRWKGEPLVVRSQKGRALLLCLALRPEGLTRLELAELLWQPDRLGSVRQALHELRKLPSAERWLESGETVRLRAHSDVRAFEEALDAERYEDALATWPAHVVTPSGLENLWRALLPGTTEAFADWLELERLRVAALYRDGARSLALELAQSGADGEALVLARQLLAHDDLDESVHRLVMRLELRRGRPQAAIDQYAACRRSLMRELGVEPLAQTQALLAEVERHLPEPAHATPAEDAPSGTSRPAAGNPPRATTPFVGRAKELDDIRALLDDPACRLLTITGPGGIGKTRLASEVASMVAETGRSVHFVALAPIGSPEQVVSAIAQEMGLTFGDLEDANRQLLRALRDQHFLLVLDNFEHLVDGAGLLLEILATAPGVTLLVTSRERLSVTPEWLLELSGLRVPSESPAPSATQEPADALELFARCARRARPSLRLDDARTLPHVTRICRLLQGVPLAIELAAAWTRLLPCEVIADELEDDFDLLQGHHKDLEPRHRSMGLVFEGSWQRLTPNQRQAFARLTVFRGSFDRQAAKQVAGVPLHLLLALMDKSLLRSSVPGRFELLEVVRQYGFEKLAQNPELLESTRKAHAAHYIPFLEASTVALESEDAKAALASVTEELGNIRAAWSYASEIGWGSQLERGGRGLATYFDLRGLFDEGAKAFATAREGMSTQGEAKTQATRSVLALLQVREGWFHFRIGRYGQARSLFEQSLATHNQDQDLLGSARCLYHLGNVAEALGAHEESKRLLNEALATYRQVNHRAGAVRVLNSLGLLAFARGDYEEARRLHAEGLPEREAQGDPRSLVIGLNNLGDATLRLGDDVKAAGLYARALAVSGDIGDTWGVALSTCHLGDAALARGDLAGAEAHYRSAVALCADIGLSYALAIALRGLGSARAAQGDFEEAGLALRRSLDITAGIRASPQSLETLVAVAELERARGSLVESLDLCAFVLEHGPPTSHAVKKATSLAGRLRGELSRAELREARHRAASLDLDGVVASVLGASPQDSGYGAPA